MAENDDLEIEPSIAEAMGFSSFGVQSGKRRKLNENTTFVDVNPTSSSGHSESRAANPSGADNLMTKDSAGSSALPQRIGKPVIGEESLQQKRGKSRLIDTVAATNTGTATAANIDGNNERTLQAFANGVRNENELFRVVQAIGAGITAFRTSFPSEWRTTLGAEGIYDRTHWSTYNGNLDLQGLANGPTECLAYDGGPAIISGKMMATAVEVILGAMFEDSKGDLAGFRLGMAALGVFDA